MLTSKQRSNLRAIATNVEPAMQLGKGGVTESYIAQINEMLFHKEMVKITVLRNAEYTAKEIAEELAKLCKAELVAAIGSKVILYKRSTKKDIEHIVF